jgi:pimeloyl-ACP methyl ester carboxylesterase
MDVSSIAGPAPAPLGERSEQAASWTARLPGLAAAAAVALLLGWLSAQLAPRGPINAEQALLVMVLALLAGAVGGLLVRSRWVLLVVALGTVVGVEAGRLDLGAASLAFRLDNAYGIIAFVLSRGLHGLLALLPMTLGVLAGIGLARRLGLTPARPARRPPIGSVLLVLLVVGLAVLVILPASTPAVLGGDGRPLPGSLAELTSVELGGDPHAVLIRAADPDAPVLLYLSGGPGQSDLALVRVLTSGWAEDLVVVSFDQRGNGKSYPALDPLEDVTLDRAVDDVIELTEYLRERFDEQRIYLMGESWGTLLGVLAVQHRPDLYHAWIGSGQMVDVVETDQGIYRELVAYAEGTSDDAMAATLAGMGEPPYRDLPWSNATVMGLYELLYGEFTPSEGYLERGEASGLDPFGMLGREYAFMEKANVLRGLIDTFEQLYPQLDGLDLRESARKLEVPVWILDGAAELHARRSLALAWFDLLEAPSKELVTFEEAAHAVAFQQADEVQRLLVEEIIPTTYDT